MSVLIGHSVSFIDMLLIKVLKQSTKWIKAMYSPSASIKCNNNC